MAKKEEKKKTKAKTKAKAKAKAGYTAQLFIIFSLITGAVFLPSSFMLAIGMLPTIVVALTEFRRRKTKAVTVGAMNLAGCMPFLLQLWYQGHSFERSIALVSDPMAITVMYSSAGVGYLIDWSVTGIVASILYQRGLARQKAIRNRQKELAERWGQEVTGKLALDEQGFPIGQPAEIKE